MLTFFARSSCLAQLTTLLHVCERGEGRRPPQLEAVLRSCPTSHRGNQREDVLDHQHCEGFSPDLTCAPRLHKSQTRGFRLPRDERRSKRTVWGFKCFSRMLFLMFSSFFSSFFFFLSSFFFLHPSSFLLSSSFFLLSSFFFLLSSSFFLLSSSFFYLLSSFFILHSSLHIPGKSMT